MQWYSLVVGIEHLMTGITFHTSADTPHGFQFRRESPSMMRVYSDAPFYSIWDSKLMDSTPSGPPAEIPFGSVGGHAQFYGQVVSPAISMCWQKLYDARHDRDQRIPETNEPKDFPQAVVEAVVRKHGAHALRIMKALRWAGDHWYYNDGEMYVGVEPDGYIHT